MRRASASGRRFLHPHLRLLHLLLLLFRDRLVQRAEILAVDHAVGREFRAVLFEDVFYVGFAVQMLIDQVCVLAAYSGSKSLMVAVISRLSRYSP